MLASTHALRLWDECFLQVLHRKEQPAGQGQDANSGRGVFGRAERIRTSDPLLPKQVRYQAAPQPDRAARDSAEGVTWQGGGGGREDQSGLGGGRGPRRSLDRNGAMRKPPGVPARERVRKTGVVDDPPPRSSRNTM